MLLKKPFAFLIKHFKLIHLILTILTIYLILRTNEIFKFIAEYLSSNLNIVGTNITSTLFPPIIIAVIIGILVITLIVLGLMNLKEKPRKLYIYNILVYVFVSGVLIYSYSVIRTLEIGLVSVRVLKAVQDLTVASLVLQAISLLMISVRATGFNIKRFNFNEDLDELEITKEDSEEFEIAVEVDTDEFRRGLRKKLRHAKYVYIENRFIINMVVLLNIALILFIIYMNSGVYKKVYKQNEAFSTKEYMVNVIDSYITSKDYNDNEIVKDKKLVVVNFNIRSIYNVSKKVFTDENFSLNINNKTYYPVDNYIYEIADIGSIYQKQYITSSFNSYIMVFLIPENQKNNEMILKYNDLNNKYIDIKINPVKDEKQEVIGTYALNQEFSLKNTIYKDTKAKISSFELAPTFINNYKYCVDTNNCIDGNEYIKPNTSDNYEKILMKLVGYAKKENNDQFNLYKLFKDYGRIVYTKNDEQFEMKLGFNQIKPVKGNSEDTYYIEVDKDIQEAATIKLVFKLRDKIYEIIVK